jgi:hypothetical protein
MDRASQRKVVSQNHTTFKAAARHVASTRTIDAAVSFVAEAANNSVPLAAARESFVPGFPHWAALRLGLDCPWPQPANERNGPHCPNG